MITHFINGRSLSLSSKFILNVTATNYSYVITTDFRGGVSYTYDFSRVPGKDDDIITNTDFENFLHVSRQGSRASFKTEFGLEFSQNGYFGNIRLPLVYSGAVTGLCGNFNQIKTDDYKGCTNGRCWIISGTPRDPPDVSKCTKRNGFYTKYRALTIRKKIFSKKVPRFLLKTI